MPGKVKDQGKKAAQQLNGTQKLPRQLYETELFRLQGELVKMQEWVRAEGARIVVIFEGRDAAGKGSTIKRVTEYLNPRVARIVALPAPTERERTQWYFQRYVDHLPAAGELVLFDRSWYNRAGVEHVMGFCTKEEYSRFLHQCPIFERLLVEDGILLRKYWFSVSDEEQQRRFRSRLHDPMRSWKLSPMDLESITRWEDYSRAKDEMFVHTDIPEAPWHVVESDDKRRARINMIAHLLSTIPYHEVRPPTLKLPPRPPPRDTSARPGTCRPTSPTTPPSSGRGARLEAFQLTARLPDLDSAGPGHGQQPGDQPPTSAALPARSGKMPYGQIQFWRSSRLEMMMSARLSSVGVYCASSPGVDPAYAAAAAALGQLLADRGIRLVYGGGHVGLMGVLADACLARGGEVHGVITRALEAKEVAHRGLTSPVEADKWLDRPQR